jgi:hypothetical protein
VKARLRLTGPTRPVVEIQSKDLRQSFKHDLQRFNFSSGELVSVKLRCTIENQDKPETVTFDIVPPRVTDLARKKHAGIISDYLKENGVRLV